ncbi:hypothetical protein CEXT_497321 [Caerostris extrusa]|uniref:Uncharacterized protein n=1 Tax=Caerostris extrusa TaxID=172846 RepID=A0AAV4N8L5_CAEEX|nr:hypothetical protein CEXT_497321 [Caerostris extrusa]
MRLNDDIKNHKFHAPLTYDTTTKILNEPSVFPPNSADLHAAFVEKNRSLVILGVTKRASSDVICRTLQYVYRREEWTAFSSAALSLATYTSITTRTSDKNDWIVLSCVICQIRCTTKCSNLPPTPKLTDVDTDISATRHPVVRQEPPTLCGQDSSNDLQSFFPADLNAAFVEKDRSVTKRARCDIICNSQYAYRIEEWTAFFLRPLFTYYLHIDYELHFRLKNGWYCFRTRNEITNLWVCTYSFSLPGFV